MTSWFVLVEKEAGNAAYNMAIDQCLLDRIDNGNLTRPVLRVYAWKRPTLSLGFHQQWRRTVVPEELERHGVDLVRRPTGGRAVLHETDELTYAVVAPIAEPFTRRISVNYKLIGQALHCFSDIGGHETLPAAEDSGDARKMRHTPCFASLSQFEIKSSERKLIGSAQKLGKNGFLQHGSIPVAPDMAVLEAVTGTELKMGRIMTGQADLYAAAGQPLPDRGGLTRRLIDAFASVFDIGFEEIAPPDEQERASWEQRFRDDAWTCRK